MDVPPSPLFRQVAVEAASGTQIGASLSTHWRGVPVFTAIAAVLLAALIAFVAVVEYAPVHRVAAFVDARAGPGAAGESVQGGPPAFAITSCSASRKRSFVAGLPGSSAPWPIGAVWTTQLVPSHL